MGDDLRHEQLIKLGQIRQATVVHVDIAATPLNCHVAASVVDQSADELRSVAERPGLLAIARLAGHVSSVFRFQIRAVCIGQLLNWNRHQFVVGPLKHYTPIVKGNQFRVESVSPRRRRSKYARRKRPVEYAATSNTAATI